MSIYGISSGSHMKSHLATCLIVGVSLLIALAIGVFLGRRYAAPQVAAPAPSARTPILVMPRATRTVVVSGPELQKVESTLYTRPYKVEQYGRVALPEHVRFEVLPRYRGVGGGVETIDERITVVLNDEPNHFWPVIVKMPIAEAEKLEGALARTIAEKKPPPPSAGPPSTMPATTIQ
jgi:hypothetical protein